MQFGFETRRVVIVQHALAVHFQYATGCETTHQGSAHFHRVHCILPRKGQRLRDALDGQGHHDLIAGFRDLPCTVITDMHNIFP